MNKKVLFVGLLAGCFGMNAFAATEIYVSASTGNDSYNGASWETAYKTLQYAVASVKENEETIIYLEANTTFDTGGQLDFGEALLSSMVAKLLINRPEAFTLPVIRWW